MSLVFNFFTWCNYGVHVHVNTRKAVNYGGWRMTQILRFGGFKFDSLRIGKQILENLF